MQNEISWYWLSTYKALAKSWTIYTPPQTHYIVVAMSWRAMFPSCRMVSFTSGNSESTPAFALSPRIILPTSWDLKYDRSLWYWLARLNSSNCHSKVTSVNRFSLHIWYSRSGSVPFVINAAISIPVSPTTRTLQLRPGASSIVSKISDVSYQTFRSFTSFRVSLKNLSLTASSTKRDKSPFFRPCWARYIRKARSISSDTTSDQRVFIVQLWPYMWLCVYTIKCKIRNQKASPHTTEGGFRAVNYIYSTSWLSSWTILKNLALRKTVPTFSKPKTFYGVEISASTSWSDHSQQTRYFSPILSKNPTGQRIRHYYPRSCRQCTFQTLFVIWILFNHIQFKRRSGKRHIASVLD